MTHQQRASGVEDDVVVREDPAIYSIIDLAEATHCCSDLCQEFRDGRPVGSRISDLEGRAREKHESN
jgi:hypothetical protein